jgi:hypothetical protein
MTEGTFETLRELAVARPLEELFNLAYELGRIRGKIERLEQAKEIFRA